MIATEQQERNIAAYMRMMTEVWAGGKLEVCYETFAERFVRHDANGPDVHGPGGYAELIGKLREAFPDMRIEIDNIQPLGNVLFTRTTMHAAHRGEFYGIKPTGAKIVSKSHAEIHFADDGMCIEAWVISDYLGVMKAIVNAMSFWQKLSNLPALLRLMRN